MSPHGSLIIGSELEIAEHVIEDLSVEFGEVIACDGVLYTWTGTHWTVIPSSQLFPFIKPYDGLEYGHKGHKRLIRLSNQKIDAIEKLIIRNRDCPGFFDEPETGVPCQNGFVTFADDQAKLVPHHKKHLNRHILPVPWTGDIATEPPPDSLLHRYLEGVFRGDPEGDDKRTVLAEIAGITLAGCATRLTAPKVAVLYGASAANGKSQFQALLRALVPENAQVTLSPSHLGDDRSVAMLDGAWLVSASEIGGKAIASEALKAAVTGDPMPGRPLYRSGFTVRPKAQFVYSANSLPPFTNGMDAGIRRRLLIVSFNRTIPLAERLDRIGELIGKHELALAVAWAIGGALRAIRQRGYSRIPSSDAVMRDWVIVSDPFECWLSDPQAVAITGEERDRLTTRTAYAAYRQWGQLEGLRDADIGSQTRFTQRLKSLAALGVHVRHSNKGNMVHGLKPGQSVTRHDTEDGE
tara:strand:- start:6744 stop:8141 length:1398 start_codon:yes stop_codon:yes gene_type:complete